jgi:DNA ligase 1
MHRRQLLRLGSMCFATVGLGFSALTARAAKTRGSDAAQGVLLAQDYAGGLDLAQYWVSEKLDGVRALWDGRSLRFRSGRPIAAPAWFLAKLPSSPLDGELWLGRGEFDAVSGTVRRTVPVDAQWQRVRYHVFELPQTKEAAPSTFTQRAAQLQAVVRELNWPVLQAAAQFKVATEAQLLAKLGEVVKGGGEGLMLHLANAPYLVGRQAALLKLKAVSDDEATVLGHVPGKGKHTGRLGALDVRTSAGLRLRIGTGFTDAQRQDPPPVGSRITYSYRDKTPSGKPRFAAFLRMAEID